jgi:hypothetical protein
MPEKGIHRPPRVQFYLGSDDAVQAMKELKQYYATDSAAHVALRALCDHAASLREPKQEKRVTLSRRVY